MGRKGFFCRPAIWVIIAVSLVGARTLPADTIFKRPTTPRTFASCIAALGSIHEPGELPYSDIDVKEYNDTSPNLKLLREWDGKYGQIYEIERTGDRWGGGIGQVKHAPEGDPRWLIHLLGEEAAALLGYRMISDRVMEIPDPAELNGRMRELEVKYPQLGEALRFYEFTPTKSPLKRYMKRYLENGGLPADSEETHRIHDLTFHNALVLLPPRLTDQSRHVGREVEGFYDYLRSEMIEALGEEITEDERKAVDGTVNKMRIYSVGMIDQGTGLMAFGVLRYFDNVSKGHAAHDGETYRDVLHYMMFSEPDLEGGSVPAKFGSPERAIQHFAWTIEDLLSTYLSETAWDQLDADHAKVERINYLLDKAALNLAATDYIEKRKKESPTFSESPFTEEEICQEVVQRIRLLRWIAQKEAAKKVLAPVGALR
jgi:hypothetical protein